MRIPIGEKLLLGYSRYFPLRRGKYRLVERFGTSVGYSQGFMRVTKLKYNGITMRCDLRKMLQRQFYYFGTYFLEEKVLERWTESARDAQVILDIGANLGIYSLAAAASNPKARIYAFEPTNEIASHFEQTVSQNGLDNNITIVREAMSNTSGAAYLCLFSGEHNDNEGMNYISDRRKDSTAIPIQTTTIDDFCAHHQIETIDLVKIDVQGCEAKVLKGATRIISRNALKLIFFELNWNQEGSDCCAATESIAILAEAGYQFSDPNGEPLFREAGPWLRSLSDIVARSKK